MSRGRMVDRANPLRSVSGHAFVGPVRGLAPDTSRADVGAVRGGLVGEGHWVYCEHVIMNVRSHDA